MFIIEIFKLFGSILIDSDGANKSLDKTDKKAGGLTKSLGKGIATAAKWGAGLALAAGAGAAALFGVATKAAESTDRIDKLSQKIGLSRKGFQEWEFIMSQSGASVEVLQSGFKTFAKQIDEASKGTKLSTGYFKDLGVSIEDNNGKMKSQEQLFNETVVALQGMEEGPKKAALASNILGKSASELAPLINGATGSVEEMRKKANDLGLVLGDDAVDAGVKFTDSVDQMKRSLGAMATNIGASVMPIIQGLLEWVTVHMPEIKTVFKVAFDVIGGLVEKVGGFITDTLVPAFTSLYDWIEPNIPKIKETIKTAFELIKTAIDDVSDAITAVIDWAKKYQDALIPLGAGIAAGVVIFGLYSLAIGAASLATTIWTTMTAIATGVGTAFAAVLAFITSPIGLVVIAIGLLVAAGVLLYRNWDVVKAKATEIFGAIGRFIGGVIDGIKGGFRGMVNGVISGLNTMIRGLNKLKFTVPDWVPRFGGRGFGFNLPIIPSFAVGTRYLPEDMLIKAHKGEMVVPKSENPYANSGKKVLGEGGSVLVTGNTFVIREEADIEKISQRLYRLGQGRSRSLGVAT